MALPDQETLARELTQMLQQSVLEGASDLTPQTNLFARGLDSMAIMQLLLLIEERYGFMPPAEDLTHEHFATAHDLAGLLRQRTAAQG